MLDLDNLRITRGSFSLAADLKVEPGAHLCLMGPSGAGKSTLLAAIGGFIDPASGRIRWNGTDITDSPPAARPVSTVFQDHNLFPHMTAFENAALGLTPRRRLTPEESARTRDALARVGLQGYEDRRPAALSGGQQSRVALARVLLQRNPVVCLDEPFSALGPGLKSEMIGLVRELAESLGALLILVTHDPDEARQLGGLTSVVAEGTVAAPCPTDRLLDDPPAALRAYLGR